MNWEITFSLVGVFVAAFMLIKKLRNNREKVENNIDFEIPKSEISQFQKENLKPETLQIGLGPVVMSPKAINLINKYKFFGFFILFIVLFDLPIRFFNDFFENGFDSALREVLPLTITALLITTIFSLTFTVHKYLGIKTAGVFFFLCFVCIPAAFIYYVLMNWG